MQSRYSSIHEYAFDGLGRQTADAVTALGSDVDGAVRRIGLIYEVRGMVQKVTSYDDAAGTTPVNEVQNIYNVFSQLESQYQEHAGTVNLGTSPSVTYGYEDGSLNTIRPTLVSYPNGRVLEYLYDDMGAEKLSRVSALRWDGGEVVRYTYLGLGSFVQVEYPDPHVRYNLATGSELNPYAGLDRYGRVIDLLWENTEDSTELVHLQYGYDLSSNRTHRKDLVARSADKNFDELYEYDGLNRLKKFHRGRLIDEETAIETPPALQQGWQLDATGNWKNFTQNDPADDLGTFDQQRAHNRVNEITDIARTVGRVDNVPTPQYDRNGNMTAIPEPQEITDPPFLAIWDAWNRLVAVDGPNDGGGTEPRARYRYDGQTWRIGCDTYESSVLTETRDLYYSAAWQVLEEHLEAEPKFQYVWGLRYIDDLAQRDEDANGDGSFDTTRYALQDANWNMAAISDQDIGAVEERYVYTPYGKVSYLSRAWASRDESEEDWRYLFQGGRLDPAIGMYCFRYRELQPVLGRWVNRDPIGYQSGYNLVAYCANRPTSLVDPLGTAAIGKFQIMFDSVANHIWGSQTTIMWYPTFLYEPDPKDPAKSLPAKDPPCDCKQVRLYQIAESTTMVSGIIDMFYLPIANKNIPWHPDPTEGTEAFDWVKDAPVNQVVPINSFGADSVMAHFKDSPGSDDDVYGRSLVFIPTSWILSRTQSFETCAVCINPDASKHYMEVFGCIHWSINVEHHNNTVEKTFYALKPFGTNLTVNESNYTGKSFRTDIRRGVKPSKQFLQLILPGKLKW